MLQSHDGWTVCAKATNGREAVAAALQFKPDVAILDLAMPEMDGLAAAREIARNVPGVAILIYTLHDGGLIELEAKKAGVRKVVSKMSSPESLVLAVEEVLKAGETRAKPTTVAIPAVSGGPLGDAPQVNSLDKAKHNPAEEPDASGKLN